jgi:hypothetical protein
VRVAFGGPFQLERANDRVFESSIGLIGAVITTLVTFPEASVEIRTDPFP